MFARHLLRVIGRAARVLLAVRVRATSHPRMRKKSNNAEVYRVRYRVASGVVLPAHRERASPDPTLLSVAYSICA